MRTSDTAATTASATEDAAALRQVIALAVEMAVPVVRGALSERHARCALVNAALREHRAGRLKCCPFDAAGWAGHVMALHVAQLVALREVATGRIHRAIEPMLIARTASNRIRAVAHDCNGCLGSPLTEREVEEVAIRAALDWMEPNG